MYAVVIVNNENLDTLPWESLMQNSSFGLEFANNLTSY